MSLAASFPGLVLLAASAGARPQEPGPDLSQLEAPKLLQIARRERNETDPAVFAELASRADGLAALEECAALVDRSDALEAVFAAIASQRGDDERGTNARALLERAAWGTPIPAQRPATRALASQGSAALAELERIVSEHPDADCRSIAVGGLLTYLRHRGDAQALEWILQNFRAPLSGPRAAGARTLAAFRDPASRRRLVDAIDDRALPPGVRALAVEALAEQGDPADRPRLAAALRERDLGVRLAALRALAACGGPEEVQAVRHALRAEEAVVRCAALTALDRLCGADPTWRDELARLAGDSDPALRIGAAQAVLDGERAGSELALISRLAADPDALVRRRTVEALGRWRDARAVPILLARLEGDTLRVREAARASLLALTGEDHGARAARWMRWWAAEGEGYALPSPEAVAARIAERAASRAEDATEARFFGLPLGSDRVAFVIDTSGSMDALTATGRTRLATVAVELDRTLAGFPPGGRFNLLFFSDRVRRWRRALVERDEAALEAAHDFIRSQRAVGGTGLHAGLVEALEDLEVDTLVLLTDGEPTEGRLIRPDDILADLELRNELRGVVVHCVSVGCASRLLRDMAAATGGQYREVH